LGEERLAKRIAERIGEARRAQPITTTVELARLVVSAYPVRMRHSRLHPATRTFQALRMAVNDELGALEELLDSLPDVLAAGGRAALLTYQSLDDRLVKHTVARGMREGLWTVLTKKPERPTAEEVCQNRRVRSVKLRAVERR
jgi:16S rRNA (cytosine1402-N4)-methyltransferase